MLLCLWSSTTWAQESFRVMFYNVENLFDAKDDTLKNDQEFLPEATRKWNYFRYKEKINKIARVIISTSKDNIPDLVGLCEVENDSCLLDLIKYSPLREAGYRYVMTHSPDERGIDVALMYQRGTFKLLEKQVIPVPLERLRKSPTRDILHVAGQVISGDTLDVFVCHMPSRSEGEKRTEPYRLFASQILKSSVDSLMKIRQHPYLLVMGDFNDTPHKPSVSQLNEVGLINMMDDKSGGTYQYRGKWEILDQFLVSESLSNDNGRIHTVKDQSFIIRYPFLLEEDDKYGGEKPYRTYHGMKYQGGYSDHLPIAIDLIIRDDKDYYSE